MLTESPTRVDFGSSAPLSRPAKSKSSHGVFAIGRSSVLTISEWAVAVLGSLVTFVLLIVHGAHAGALWRDECAAVHLAQMPSFSEIARNFQHEAFPLLFPATLRAFITMFGASDLAMRCLGIAVGIALIGAVWIAARAVHGRPPLISIALLGLNSTFLVWGTSVRGYGIGCVLIVIAFASFVRLLEQPSPKRIVLTTLASLVAVQCLLHNLVLIVAFALSASAIALAQGRPRQMITYLAILSISMASFIPYIGPYSSGSAWSMVVEFPVTARLLWNQFNAAMGNPHPALAILWYAGFVIALTAALRQFMIQRPPAQAATAKPVLWFGLVVLATSLFGYYEFLSLLSYLPRSWYYLALLAVIAVTLDLVASAGSREPFLRIARVLLCAVAFIILPFNSWAKISERQTNIDLVAHEVENSASASDLIVIAPWLYAISFEHYYQGSTPCLTLPSMTDVRIHRYDLYHEKMRSPHPIDDVLNQIQLTLQAGHKVWIVGGIKLSPSGRPHRVLSATTSPAVGWDNVDYTESWLEEMGTFVRAHAEQGHHVSLPGTTRINDFENVPLFVVEGWNNERSVESGAGP